MPLSLCKNSLEQERVEVNGKEGNRIIFHYKFLNNVQILV